MLSKFASSCFIVAAICVAQSVLGMAAVPFNYQNMAEDWEKMPDTWCDSVEQTPIDLLAPDELNQYAQMPEGFAPSFELPDVDNARAENTGYNVHLLFSTDGGSTFPYPAGGTFTSLSGPYSGKLIPEVTAASGHVKEDYPKGDPSSPEFAQGILIDLHWHEPSEHSIDGKLFAAEAHFVHVVDRPGDPDCTYMAGDQGPYCLAVIGVLYDMVIDEEMNSTEAVAFTKMMDDLGSLPNVDEPPSAPIPVDFGSFLPESKDFFHYRGSLTTPGCNENVTWYVLQQPMAMAWSDWNEMQNSILYEELGDLNARPPLPLNDRTVFVTNYDELFGAGGPSPDSDTTIDSSATGGSLAAEAVPGVPAPTYP